MSSETLTRKKSGHCLFALEREWVLEISLRQAMSDHPVIDSLRASFDSYLRGHGEPPECMYLGREDIEKYKDEILNLNTKLHGYAWIYDAPMFHGVPIREIGSNSNARWAGFPSRSHEPGAEWM